MLDKLLKLGRTLSGAPEVPPGPQVYTGIIGGFVHPSFEARYMYIPIVKPGGAGGGRDDGARFPILFR